MFIVKKKYFFFVENTKNIDFNKIKKLYKFNIIYRSKEIKEKMSTLLKFRNICKKNRINFYIANHVEHLRYLNADGLYISAYNNNLKYTRLKNLKYKIIGSAHNIKEIQIKKMQGCQTIFISRLFKTNYKNKYGYLGLVKYNLFSVNNILAPLGGINKYNLNYLKNIKCNSFALSSAFINDNSMCKMFY
jgi:thiamine-phosphate pyrophosphorylase